MGTQFDNPGGFDAFKPLVDIVPRPGHKASGEERLGAAGWPSGSASAPPGISIGTSG